MRPRSGRNRSPTYSHSLPFSSFVVSRRIMRDYNQHVRLLSSDPLVGLRLQSLFGPGSRHCFGIIALIKRCSIYTECWLPEVNERRIGGSWCIGNSSGRRREMEATISTNDLKAKIDRKQT